MHLSKTAARKAGKVYNIADEELLHIDSRGYDPPNCDWNDKVDRIEVEVRGQPQSGSKYDYTISFSGDEIIHFIKMAVEASSSNLSEKSLGLGAITLIEQLIKSTEDEDYKEET